MPFVSGSVTNFGSWKPHSDYGAAGLGASMDQLQPWHCPLDEVGKYFNFRNFVSLTIAKDKTEEENKCKGKK